MKNRFKKFFHSGHFTGQVVVSNDQFAMIRFQNFAGFVSLATHCDGDFSTVMTICVPPRFLYSAIIEDLKFAVLDFFECEDFKCLVVMTRPTNVTPSKLPAKMKSGLPDVRLILQPKPAEAESEEEELFSFPRRFDLASMLSISTGYAILFAVMRLFSASPELTFGTGGLIALVGVSQAVLFDGKSPRTASLIVGGLYCAIVIGIVIANSHHRSGAVFGGVVLALFWGPPAGYLCGTLVGGIFLIAEYVRRAIAKFRGEDSDSEKDDVSSQADEKSSNH